MGPEKGFFVVYIETFSEKKDVAATFNVLPARANVRVAKYGVL